METRLRKMTAAEKVANTVEQVLAVAGVQGVRQWVDARLAQENSVIAFQNGILAELSDCTPAIRARARAQKEVAILTKWQAVANEELPVFNFAK